MLINKICKFELFQDINFQLQSVNILFRKYCNFKFANNKNYQFAFLASSCF